MWVCKFNFKPWYIKTRSSKCLNQKKTVWGLKGLYLRHNGLKCSPNESEN